MRIKEAFILAAGFGRRMQPITDRIPKPMVEIHGRSLITRIIDKLVEYNIEKIVINSFYKADILKKHIDSHIQTNNISATVKIIQEQELLETGGGVINALHHLQDKPFFVVNGDSLWHGEENIFKQLARCWNNGMHSLFLLKNVSDAIGYDYKGDFGLTKNNMLVCPAEYDFLPYAYAGIHITKPSNFSGLKVKKCKLMDIYASEKIGDIYKNIYGIIYQGAWFHIGTPQSIIDTEKLLENHLS